MKALWLTSLFLLSVLSFQSIANAPSCSPNYGGYCHYSGKVSRIYVNAGNIILLYFDAPIATEDASAIGISISNGSAAAFKIDDNPEFATLFYSTALAAQASGRSVSIQMRGVESGYLKFDRIWLAAP